MSEKFKSLRSYRRGALGPAISAAVLFSCCIQGFPAGPVAEAGAQEVAQREAEDLSSLIASMGKVAQDVAVKNEEVKALEDGLAESERHLVDSESRARQAQDEARHAEDALHQQRLNINGIAQSRYRGDSRDPMTATFSAEDPSSAVERLSYLGAISRQAQRSLNTVSAAAESAQIKRTEAESAVKEAEDARRALDEQRNDLVSQKQGLERQQAEIKAKVDSLSTEQRAAWERQFNPIDPASIGKEAHGVVAAALAKLGSPYGWGAAGPDTFDCSGLMVWAYQQEGKSIPRTSQAQIAGGQHVDTKDLQPGDIVGYYPGVTHVGMYIGNGQVIHASTYGVPVQVVPVDSMPIQGASRY